MPHPGTSSDACGMTGQAHEKFGRREKVYKTTINNFLNC